ncbi:MAG: preprotein translocase subunit YajC [Opitutales bacterium]|nr:preprotein translocase subunit YajC [Opitutales bacterium]
MNSLLASSCFYSNSTSLLALAPPQGDGQSETSVFSGMLPFILIFAAMWFLLIAPQRKKQKRHDKMVQEMQPGAQVITIGGLHGTITSIKDDRFVLKIGDNVKVEVTKASIANVVERS